MIGKPNPLYQDSYSEAEIENLYQLAANGCPIATAEYDWATRDHKVFGQP